jgi:two-component system CheB/CheR fusion protein
VQKSLREMVMFATHNVIQDPPFSKVDLVCCRNLLIYLNRHVQAKVLDLLHFSLRPDGYLLLGMSESVDDENGSFVAVDKTVRIYQQQPRARMGMHMMSLPTVGPARMASDLAPAGRRLVSYAELHQNLLEHYAPASLVVDERLDLVHVSETAGRFLRIAGGEPSLNLMKVAPEELRFELRGMLENAMRTMRSVERNDVPMRRGTQLSRLSIKVHPVRERTTMRTYALVILDETPDVEATPLRLASGQAKTTVGLEQRLQDTQAQLRSAVEQYEIQNEELKASNEELQATNEELRATSEELETGKEELQSINEELTTVNQELKNKVDETTRISDDLQNFISSTEIAVLFVDRQFRLMRFTPFAREIFNFIGSDIGRPLLDITHRLADVEFDKDVATVLETLRDVERELRASNGRWYIMRILPYRTKEDRIGGAVLTFIDITQRKAAEDATKRSRAWLQVVVDSVADYAILTIAPDGRIESWNRGAERLFGYAADEAVGQNFGLIFLPEDRAAGTPENEMRTAREAGRAEDERWQLRKDGTRFFASGVTAPLADPNAHGYVKLIRDLTQHQLVSQQRESALELERLSREAAEEANRLKDEFLATLSHELRNPLALCLMQTELLQRSPELRKLPKLAGAVDVIHQMVRAQGQFVEDMLDVSRLRTGKLTLERQLVPLPFIIADSIGALRDEAERNNVTLDFQVPKEPLIVEADPVRVRQIAWNLLSNAIKFTPRGGIVKVQLRRDGDSAQLDVEDTGQGIAPDVLPQIFEWFRQGEGGPARRKGGMGIGLALVKQLVELHGGRVEAASGGLGKGARFTVCLPLQKVDTKAAAAPSAPIAAGERLRGIRLLVIDDAPANAEILRELLQLEGADATLETSAHDAIRRASNQSFDVIISDLAMPGMDGYTMLKELRASPLNADTPAIAYSGFGGPEEEARSRKAGYALHLTKPADLDQLVEAIVSLARREPTGKPAESPSRRSAD